jgi:hypothetical protein
MSNLFDVFAKTENVCECDVQSIIENSKDMDEVKQAEFIMFSWDEWRVHPNEVREMYEIMVKAQKLLDMVKNNELR